MAMRQYALRRESANRFCRNSSKEFNFSTRQYCLARTSHRYSPNSTKRVSFSCSLARSQDRISSIRPSTKTARFRLISGVSMAPRLIHKLVQPSKVVPSRCPNQIDIYQLLIIEAQTDVRAVRAAVLGKTNTAMERELRGLNLADGIGQQSTEFGSLFFRDGGSQILNFGVMLSHERHERHFGDTGDPGIADQLWVERKQTCRFLAITAGRGLPVHNTPNTI